jgi:hypothetical protein
MHLPIIFGSENHKFLLYALFVFADIVAFFEMQLQSLIFAVVAVRVVFAAHMACFVVFFHVLYEHSHIEKVHLAKLAPRMVEYDLSVFVNLSLVKMALQLLVTVQRELLN